jgi:imidazolonepropionase-like amidohydrolase
MARTFLENCRIVDGTGKKAIESGVVVMDNESMLFTFVGRSDAPDLPKKVEGDRSFDMHGNTAMPGLFNVHAHLALILPFTSYKVDRYNHAYWPLVLYRRAAEALNCGITTIRCVAEPYGADFAIRDAINKRMLWGPRIVAAGNMIIAHGGHSHHNIHSVECSGVPAFREAARDQIKRGADLVKIALTGGLSGSLEGFSDKQMTDDEVTAVVEVAHMAGKKVAVHIGGDKPIQDAVRLGVDSIEHAYVMSRETAGMMKVKGAWLVPTLAVTHAFSYLEAHGSPEYQIRKAREAAHTHWNAIQYAIEAGVNIAVGTDLLPSDPLDGTNATVREIELLVEAGMKPLDAIKAATSASAKLCGVDKATGSLEAGKEGDVIVVAGKPDEKISDLRNLLLVARQSYLVWSKIPGLEKANFKPTDPRTPLEGGTFKKW